MTGLETRDALPEALRILIADFPREGWEAHPNFDGLTRFWLDRHLMFRSVLERLRKGTEAYLDGAVEPPGFARELQQVGGFFLNELHTHHYVEDNHYFPKLQGLEARLESGFGILDADHHVLDAHIHGMADGMNAVLRVGQGDAAMNHAGHLQERLEQFERFMDRHLTDEEELIVPVILKFAPRLE